jgi:GTP-binding protein
VVSPDDQRSFVVADIPGLIEGAHQGTGLGHQFLKHIERTACLAMMVDTSPFADQDACLTYDILRYELEAFSAKLSRKPYFVIATKADIHCDEDSTEELRKHIAPVPLHVISAASGTGIPELVEALWNLKEEGRANPDDQESFFVPVVQEKDLRERVDVEVIDGIFYVRGELFITRARRVNFDTDDAVFFFNKLAKRFEVKKALERAGIKEGDMVDIDGMEFDFHYGIF